MNALSRTRFFPRSLSQWFCQLLLVTMMGMCGAGFANAQSAQMEAEADMPSPLTSSPLAPLPLNSPRATFGSFQTLSQNAVDTILEAIDVASNNNAFFDTAEVKALKAKGMSELVAATQTLDLSSVAPESRRSMGLNAVLLLKEILERIDVPDISQAPLSGEVAPNKDQPSWSLPGTEIRMVGLPDANGTLRYKFSSDTVERLPEFYARVRDLPQKTGSEIDFYRTFTLGPGLSAPIELYSYLTRLPPAFLRDYGGQAAWQWMAFGVLTVLLLGTSATLLVRVFGRSTQGSHVPRAIVLLVVALLLGIYGWLNDEIINTTGELQAAIEVTVLVLQGATLAALVVLVFYGLARMVHTLPGDRREGLDASLLRLAIRVVGIILAAFILATVATRLGMPLYGVVASLGVGGLALALAVRPTLENFIGGLILYADRPVAVGEMCKFGGVQGTVEAIGLRSTKIRAVDRTLITVQNSDFAEMSITNFSRRDGNQLQFEFDVWPDADGSQVIKTINEVAAKLREDHRIQQDSVRVLVREMPEDALKLEIQAQSLIADWTDFLDMRQKLLLALIDMLKTRNVLRNDREAAPS
ncbi:hypothetical protein PSAL_032390 [Pseudooceanicola algae]|uniref:Mechanosensitive ion channel MscS domain-containing protein n=2 Tax=Pseudooceanicola algae TaxID=1537215 RepID=A0A418SJ31_9RHOB|nr:hypothetical protein PSAL_032390 [Pseudooceanicola algae]